MRQLLLAAVLSALFLAHVVAAHAEWIVDAAGDIGYEDNLTRATRRADRRSDIALSPALSIGHYFQLADATSLLATADFKGNLYPRFERLSNLSSTLTLGVRQKFGLGASAPWLRVFATGGALDYAVRLAVAMREQVAALTERWRQHGHTLGFGVGIAMGFATLGKIGFEGRFDYAAIGSVCNLSARLCAEARAGQILVSEPVFTAVQSIAEVEEIPPLTLKGFAQPVPTYNILKLKDAD